mmetsp:Transcript_15504/g.60640  ORF Transcript_15504/g.60640 Transcript_15504/m.60640 type:complete len:334 (+) Transcript_15504:17-1018(+)
MGKRARGDGEGTGKIGRPPKYPRPAHCPHKDRKEHARGVCYQCSKNMSNKIYKQRKRATARAEAAARAGTARERQEQGLDAILAEAAADDVAQLATAAAVTGPTALAPPSRRSKRRGRAAAGEEETEGDDQLPIAGGQPLVPLAEAAARAGRRKGLDLNQGMEQMNTLTFRDDVQDAALLLPPPASPYLPTELDLPQERGKSKVALSPASFFSLSSRMSTEATGQAAEKDGTYYWYVPLSNSNSHVRIAGNTPNFSASLESIMNEIAKIAEPQQTTPGPAAPASASPRLPLLSQPSVDSADTAPLPAAVDKSGEEKKDVDGSLLSQLAIIFGT